MSEIRTKIAQQTGQTPGQIKAQQTKQTKSLSGGFEMLEKKGINIARPTAEQLNDAKKGLKIMLPMESAMEVDMGSVKSTADGISGLANRKDDGSFGDVFGVENLMKAATKNLGLGAGQSLEDLEMEVANNNLLASETPEVRDQAEKKLRAARELNEAAEQRQSSGVEAKNQSMAASMMSAMSSHLSSPEAQRMMSEVKGQMGMDASIPDKENFSAHHATMSQLVNGGKSAPMLMFQMKEKLALMQDSTMNDRKGMSMAQMAGNMLGRGGGQAATPTGVGGAVAKAPDDKVRF